MRGRISVNQTSEKKKTKSSKDSSLMTNDIHSYILNDPYMTFLKACEVNGKNPSRRT